MNKARANVVGAAIPRSEEMLAGSTIVVTGAGGFFGARVVRQLFRAGAKVRGVFGPPGAKCQLATGFESSAQVDICDAKNLQRIVAGANIVVHLAGLPFVAGSFEEPAEYVRVHTLGTAYILRACRAARVPRLVYVSSAEVQGRPQTDTVTEVHPLEARSPDGAVKIGADRPNHSLRESLCDVLEYYRRSQ